MGLNISLYDTKGRDHPDWDFTKHSGDREFASMVSELPCETLGDPSDVYNFVGYHYRPADFAAWRAALATREWPNPGRFEHMLDILEREPDYWIWFGW